RPRRSGSGRPDGDGDAGANEEAEEPADFLLLGRTGDRHCGLELGELLDRDTKLFHCLAFPSFFASRGRPLCQRGVETLLNRRTDSVYYDIRQVMAPSSRAPGDRIRASR